MKIAIPAKRTVNVTHVRMELAVRYDEEDIPNDYPFRLFELWTITVNLETGQIEGWPKGVAPRDIYMKVCDEGSYYLLDERGKVVAQRKNDYVPNDFIPGEYGDYVDFKIDANGRITNWPKVKDMDLSQMIGDEDE